MSSKIFKKVAVISKQRVIIVSLLFCHMLAGQQAGDPNEGLRISYDKQTDAFNLSWYGYSGAAYFIQQSDDLVNWKYIPTIESGLNQAIAYGFSTSAEKHFWRLVKDERFTADLNSDDWDNDGLSNRYEIENSLDPLNYDADADRDGDGFSNMVEYLNGTNPDAVDTVVSPSSAGLLVYTGME